MPGFMGFLQYSKVYKTHRISLNAYIKVDGTRTGSKKHTKTAPA